MIDSVIISRALQKTSRLTIPNLGTLLKKPEGEVIFSQFLRNDDMVLTSIVMNSYGVDLDEAKRMVAGFVSDIETKIVSCGVYILPELGYLASDPSGALKFKTGLPSQQPEQNRQPEQDRQPEQVHQMEPVVPQHAQVTPQPIVGIPQQGQVPQQRQFRQQTPYGPRPQQVIPQRRPQQNPQQRPQPRPQARPQQNPQQRPQPMGTGRPGSPVQQRRKVPAKKVDYLLVFAIVVAVAVLVLIAYSLFVSTPQDFMIPTE